MLSLITVARLYSIHTAVHDEVSSLLQPTFSIALHHKTNTFNSQHFQGLRRGQEKGELTAPAPTTNQHSDPSFNPITRRPGPGRGRPRKSGSVVPPPEDTLAVSQALATSDVQPQIRVDQHRVGSSAPVDINAGAGSSASGSGAIQASSSASASRTARLPSRSSAHSSNVVAQLGDLDADADGEADDFPTEDLRPSKRQRVIGSEVDLEDAEADVADVLDDEAVLALAAHNNGDVFSTGEV